MLKSVKVLQDQGPVRVEIAKLDGKMVVVKQLQIESRELAQRLEREAIVAQKLKHENIVPLLSVQNKALIYEYAPGMSLADLLKVEPIRVDRCLDIALDVLSALDYAHRNQVIHFDVKPSNIIISPQGRGLLTDFGFAKDLALENITIQEMRLGTPNYMSPEQFMGKRHDPRSDIYAVGAVMYHMLMGFPPYRTDVFRFLVGDSTLELEGLPVAGSIARVVYKALKHQADDRYQSALEMHRALRAVRAMA